MALDRISVRLSPFEKLQILRLELEDREKEQREVEATIRDKLGMIERQRYLESLSPYYASRAENTPTQDDIKALEEKRQQIADLIATINEQLPLVMEQRSGGGDAAAEAPAQVGPAKKAKFESFDDFRTKKDG